MKHKEYNDCRIIQKILAFAIRLCLIFACEIYLPSNSQLALIPFYLNENRVDTLLNGMKKW